MMKTLGAPSFRQFPTTWGGQSCPWAPLPLYLPDALGPQPEGPSLTPSLLFSSQSFTTGVVNWHLFHLINHHHLKLRGYQINLKVSGSP